MTTTEKARTSGVAPGSVVVVRDEEWLVTATRETSDGLLIDVHGLTELVRDTTATFYDSLDTITPLDPADAKVVPDTSPRYRTARLWLESTLRKTAVPLGDTQLTVSTQALADQLSYQRSAVLQALDPANIRPRILLADAVGLGKTLEIGMILSELVRRGRGERIMIVTPRHVLEQMQHEMWTRFALPFVRLDSAGIQRVRQKLPATRNPFTYYKRVIISIDTLKSDRYVTALRKQRWDAVVIDESHNLANAATLNNRLARLLSRNSEALILASATPHNGKADSFAELIRLLDPSAIPPGESILDPDEIRRLVIRRHRHSPEVQSVVGADWAERLEPNNILIPASPAENAIAAELSTTWLSPAKGQGVLTGKNAQLFPWVLAKAFLSSAPALRETVRERIRRIDEEPDAERERAALRRLDDLAEAAAGERSAKYDALVTLLKEIGIGKNSDARAVVFAERVATLKWLQKKITDDFRLGVGGVDLMHGGLADDQQQAVVERFKQASTPVRVLVTGDVASEGVNLHSQCHELIHYDIPWSLIRIEQRNGRIDRYGQKEPPRISALLLEPDNDTFAGDLRVLTRLIEKENEAHTALGDVASLMGKYDVKAEEEAIRAVLAGQQELDDVVRTPEQVVEGTDLGAFFETIFAGAATAPTPSPTPGAPDRSSGLYSDDINYLEDALAAAFIDPKQPPGNGGVAWKRNASFGSAELIPPRDLAQRLEVLPQSYLAERRVTERFVLATTQTRGRERLAAALAKDSDSTWPDAHYLSPLHPVLDWAADRALGGLGRNEVFAVRGDVDAPTVLLLGTLTNGRGQVVAASWLTVTFPNPARPTSALVEPHASAADALDSLGWMASRANPGAVDGLEQLQHLIPAAVHAASGQMNQLFDAAKKDISHRVGAWSQRLTGWDRDAESLVQRKELQQRRISVQQEKELVAAMYPDRQLMRPLLIVVDEGGDQS